MLSNPARAHTHHRQHKRGEKGKQAVNTSQEIPNCPSGAWKDFLAGVQAGDLITKNFKLVCLGSRESLLHGFQVLKESNISCAPIWDAEHNTFVGFLDMLDIVSLLFGCTEEDEFTPTKMLGTAIQSANNISYRNPWCPVYVGKPLLSVMDMFSSEGPLHHIPIADEQGNIISIISQSKVVEFLNTTIGNFRDAATLTVADTFTPKPVEYISTNSNLMDAFRKIAATRIYGLAVLDEDGAIVGNISASDLKAIEVDKIASMAKEPVGLLMKRSAEMFEKPFRALYCQKTDTLQQVLQTFALEHIHRMYIIDAQKKPVGVISLGDIIGVLDKLYL